MAINPRVWARKCHRWGAILIALPFLLVLVTGILLQLKKEWSWVQPPTAKGSGKTPQISFDTILESCKTVQESGIQSWKDVERLDVRPDRGIVKVQAHSRWEIQIDLQSGKVLRHDYRRSDLIESLHDGSWFHDSAKLWVFLPVAGIVLILWGTGLYLFFLPLRVRWSRRKRSADKPLDIPRQGN